jgi:subtilase family serine protease
MPLRKLRSLFALLLCIVPFSLLAQVGTARPSPRITQAISSSSAFTLKGSVHPLTKVYPDTGHADVSQPMEGMTIAFSPSAQQQAALKALLVAQQTPGSPQYHQWLTPAEFASEFGLAPSDVAAVSNWLQQQGFQILSSSPLEVKFSGTVAQVESAFQTRIDNYNVSGNTRRANATEISLPSVLQGVVSNVRGLNEFRPRPRVRVSAVSHYNAGQGLHAVDPADFTTLYDVAPLYNAGYTGTGETIAIVGQSEILASDIANFRSAAGLPANAPTMTLVPGSGTAVQSSDDEVESDLDVEWSGAVARNATINFVYVGNGNNESVFDAMDYAIKNDLAPVISTSYGLCEQEWQPADITTLENDFQQANAQGETVIAAAGDSGAADCDYSTNPNTPVTSATHGLAVDYPGSSAYVTSVGGTEFNGDDGAAASTYWNSTNTTSTWGEDSSAIQYIPAEVWNDTSSTNGLDAGGGGVSTLFTKPTWQTGSGVPSDGHRDVPDIALNASPAHDPYIFCSTAEPDDPTSCSNGFGDSQGYLTVAGGTSFAAPSFAGILTLINEKQGATGQGNFNPSLYAAANSSNYATAFHDVTTGNNDVPCTAGSTGCPSSDEIGYSATPGYDLASGWGALDAANFASAVSGSGTSGSGGTTGTASFSLSAASVSVAPGSTGTSTITITPAGGFTGTVAFTVTLPSNLTDSCFSLANTAVSGASPVTATLTVNTSSASCSAGSTAKLEPLQRKGDRKGVMEAGAMLLSLLFLGIPAVRRKRGLWMVLLLIAVSSAGLTGCGSSKSTSSSSSSSSGTGTSTTGSTGQTAAGTYTVTLTGTSAGMTATTSFTLTVS